MSDMWVNLNDLYQLLRRMRKDDISTVHLSFTEPSEFNGHVFPASLALSGIKAADPDTEISYTDDDEIASVDVKTPSAGYSASMSDIFE